MIRTGTQIVLVDVTVTDSTGAPVRNLKQSDFSVLENDVPQIITHFDEHTPPSAADLANTPQMPKLPANTFTNFTLTPDNAPINVLLIDTLNTPLIDQASLRRTLADFIRGIRPGTPVAVFGLSTRLFLLQGVTSDQQLLLAAVENKTLIDSSPLMNAAPGNEALSDTVKIPSPQIKETMRTGEAVQDAQRDRMRITATLNAMNQLARYLSGMPGRKNLIWLSGSFPMNFLPNLRISNSFVTTDSVQAEVRETTNLFLKSQVAIYPVDGKRLQTTPLSDVSAAKYVYGSGSVMGDVDSFTSRNFDDHNTMRLLARSTGGAAFVDTNNLRAAMDKAIDNGTNYYTLVYTPTNKSEDGAYRKITVHLASGSYNIAYRDGYYAEPPVAASPAASKPDKKTLPTPDSMQLAMQRGAPLSTQIIFKALFAAEPKQSGKPAEGNVISPKSKPPYRLITVAYAASPADISMPMQLDGTRHVDLDFVTLVYDRDGQLFNQQTNRIDVFAKPAAIQDFNREGARYQQQIAVPARGEYYLRCGIHDLIGDRIGAIEVPTASIMDGTK